MSTNVMSKLNLVLVSIFTIGLLNIGNASADEVKKPKDCLQTNYTQNIPILIAALKAKGKKIPAYEFEKEKNMSIKPTDCYLKLYDTFSELAQKYDLPPLERKKKENIVPADVFILATDLNVILKNKWGTSHTLDPELVTKYNDWKKTRKDGEDVVPGDMYHSASYLLELAKGM